VERRDELRAWLGKHDVGAEIYYPLALHMQECFAYLGHEPEDFPESLRATKESLALPIYPELEQAPASIRRGHRCGVLPQLRRPRNSAACGYHRRLFILNPRPDGP
jgi:hypothetical protein